MRTTTKCPVCRVEMSRTDPIRNLLAEQMAIVAREESKSTADGGRRQQSLQQLLLQYKQDVKVLREIWPRTKSSLALLLLTTFLRNVGVIQAFERKH